jgi:hypothetical protein
MHGHVPSRYFRGFSFQRHAAAQLQDRSAMRLILQLRCGVALVLKPLLN